MAIHHQPVLLKEVIQYLRPVSGELIIDGTVGFGGHLKSFLEAAQPNGRIIGIDIDCEVIAYTQDWLKSVLANGSRCGGMPLREHNAKEIQSVDRLLERSELQPTILGSKSLYSNCRSIELFCDNFVNTGEILTRLHLSGADVILLDLGVSSYQLDTPARGFSFQSDGPLDMRMNPQADLTAAYVVNRYKPDDLVRIFRDYGEERYSRRIVRNIAEARQKGAIKTTGQLADIIKRSVPIRGKIHPATRVFQALRIEVNREMENLMRFLNAAPGYLNKGGRLGIISFHSLEDRLVKIAFNLGKKDGVYEVLTKKPLQATDEEIAQNPRARSAKFRVIKKI